MNDVPGLGPLLEEEAEVSFPQVSESSPSRNCCLNVQDWSQDQCLVTVFNQELRLLYVCVSVCVGFVSLDLVLYRHV